MTPSSGSKPAFRPGRRPEQRPGRSGSKRDRNRNERTQQLCDAGLSLFLELGVEAVTIDEITRAAGIAKGNFYRYFDDKAQLVEAVFAPMTSSVRAALDTASTCVARARTVGELVQTYEGLARDLVVQLLPEPRLIRLYLQECRGPARGARLPIRALSDEIAERATELTRAAHSHGLLRDFPPELTALAVVGAVESLLFHRLEGMDFGDPTAAAQALITMVLEGLGRAHPNS